MEVVKCKEGTFRRWFMESKSSVSCLLSIIVSSDAVMEKLYTILKVYFTFQLEVSAQMHSVYNKEKTFLKLHMNLIR